jgi:methionyl-tRNA formyltransferase
MNSAQPLRWIFLGGRPLGVACLEALKQVGYVPEIIITSPDRPAGRGQVMTPPQEKVWGDTHGIKVLQPEKLSDLEDMLITAGPWDVFALAAYGQILSKKFLSIPHKGVVNMHPSLLPKMRGPSPMRSAILTNARDAVGVSVMIIDSKMDHGPLLAQQSIVTESWPLPGRTLDALLIAAGAQLLAETFPKYVRGEILPIEQNHEAATYCKMFEKTDAEIDLTADARTNLFKICAYDEWPGAYTFVERAGKKIRLKIVSAHIAGDTLVLDRVIPEGKKEMLYADFVRST